jgi:hypothetical protein
MHLLKFKKNLLLEINYDNKEGPGIHGTGSARKLAVVSKAHTLESGRFSSCNNFHREMYYEETNYLC